MTNERPRTAGAEGTDGARDTLKWSKARVMGPEMFDMASTTFARGQRPAADALEVAFETVAAIATVGSLRELHDLLRPALLSVGFNVFAAVKLTRPDGHIHVRILFGEGLGPWMDHCLKMGYPADDRIWQECFRTSHSFYWSEVAARTDLSATEIRILKEAREFGLRHGFVMPIHKPDASVLAVMLAGETSRPPNTITRVTSQLLANCYAIAGSHLCALEAPAIPQSRLLTLRQLECLRWSLKGKSSTDIGKIMGISARVVDDHFARACKRLGVRTRAQAVHAASSLGYLDT